MTGFFYQPTASTSPVPRRISWSPTSNLSSAMARPARIQSAVAVTRWRHLMPTLSSIKTMTISGIRSGSSHAGKQHGTVMAKTGLYLIMSVAPDKVPQPHALSRTDKVPRQPTSLPMLPLHTLTGEVPGIRSALGCPMTHFNFNFKCVIFYAARHRADVRWWYNWSSITDPPYPTSVKSRTTGKHRGQ